MQKIWQGIFWKILSCGCFAGINVLVRYLSGGSELNLSQPLPIYSIMFFQNIIGMLLISAWVLKTSSNITDLKTTRPGLHFLRIATAVLGIGLMYLSLRYIPVTQTVALGLIAPIITVIGAIIFLKENFNLQRKIAVFLSIIGSCLIARPDQALTSFASYSWYMVLPLLSALLFALDKLITRQLLNLSESPRALTWYLLTFMAPLSLIPSLYYGWVAPSLEHLPWLLLLGALGALAHYAFNKAYALAEVTFLLPFGAAKIILSVAISYIVFYEIPRTTDLWAGITIMTLSTVILSLKPELFDKQRNLAPSPNLS